MKNIFRHWLLPYSANNYRARILQTDVLFGLIGLLMIATQLSSLFGFSHVLGFATDISVPTLLKETNQQRTQNGLTTLQLDPLLNRAAEQKAQDMFTNGYWAHNRPDGTTPWIFINDAGYQYLYAGENLARDFNNSHEVVLAWMKSQTHRDNLLDSRYQDIGLAVVNGKLNNQETTLVVQMFGTKTASSLPAQIHPVAAQSSENLQVLVAKTSPTVSLFSLPVINWQKILPQIYLVLLLGVLIFDGLIIYRQKIFRSSGHNLAHFALIVIAIILINLTSGGNIL